MTKAKRTNNGFWITWNYSDSIRIYHETFGKFKPYMVQKAEANKWGGISWVDIVCKWYLADAKAVVDGMMA